MFALLCCFLAIIALPFKSRRRLEAENAVLRHQLIILRRRVPGRALLTNGDRWFFVQLYRLFPSILRVLTIIQPETLVRWHRAGFRSYWRWKSGPRGGRPQIDSGLRELIKKMSMENPLWGAPRIHGELLKLGFEVAQSSVAKYIGQATRATEAGMEDVSAQSRTRHCRHGPVRCPDHQLRSAVCAGHCTDGPQRAGLGQCHGEPDSGMDYTSSH